MKKLFLVFLIAHLSLLIFAAAPAAAHVLKSNGSVGAILHVSPDDDPIAGVSTDFFFELKDTEGKFTPESCFCLASIYRNGKEVYAQPLFQNNTSPSLEDASFSYVFPQKDIYKVQISGSPNDGKSFKPFTLSWDIRVGREAENQSSGKSGWFAEILPYIIGVVLFVVLFVVLQKKGGDKKK